ncbi:Kelch like family member 18 [Trichostrongylus colubriformis]|uniref:Kelch like family member 18 n=1 Tax=Trichostrongylus colubriformis TaxID=6319 RepID=A0AAN8FLZ8_TRICO
MCEELIAHFLKNIEKSNANNTEEGSDDNRVLITHLTDFPDDPEQYVVLISKSTVHSSVLLSGLADLREDSRLCDFVLVAKGTRINAHRVVLAACSNYFKSMFSKDSADGSLQKLDFADIESCGVSARSLGEVEMLDMDDAALVALVNFCYSGAIEINDANVFSLLQAACLLQMNEVRDMCCDFLKKKLSLSNCLGIAAFADFHKCQELFCCAKQHILHHFQEVVSTQDFHRLPFDYLAEFISSEELQVRTEGQVFEAVLDWVKFDLSARKQFLPKLLEHVRLPLCDPQFLVNTIGEDTLVKSDLICRDLVDEAKDHLLLKLSASIRPTPNGHRMRPRKVFMGEVLYVVGGYCNGKALDALDRLDPGEASPVWQTVAHLSKRRDGVVVAALDNLLYAVGGCDGEYYLSFNERFDPSTGRWTSHVAPTSTCREKFGLITLDDLLYAVGGLHDNNSVDIVERYDPRRNEWVYVAPMATRRHELSVSVFDGCLYAIGGFDGHSSLDVVERLDPRVGKWEFLRPMLTKPEKYNPLTNEWTSVAQIKTKREGLGLAVVNGKLYTLGGYDSSCDQASVEVFDPEANEWNLHTNMTDPRWGASYCVLRRP